MQTCEGFVGVTWGLRLRSPEDDAAAGDWPWPVPKSRVRSPASCITCSAMKLSPSIMVHQPRVKRVQVLGVMLWQTLVTSAGHTAGRSEHVSVQGKVEDGQISCAYHGW